MAKRQMTFSPVGIDELCEKLGQLARESNHCLAYALYDGTGILATALRNELKPHDQAGKVTRLSRNADPDRTYSYTRHGELADSIGISRFKKDGSKVHTAIVFAGYDSKGVPNAIKAAALESGAYHKKNGDIQWQKPTPFIKPAMKKCQNNAAQAMQEALDEIVAKTMEGNK